jgi:putative FmdB family regulatory protein
MESFFRCGGEAARLHKEATQPVPVYEYRCSKGHEYEKTEGFSAPAEQKCMFCRAKAKRQISRPAVIFKGSGFYSTDNKRSSAALDTTPSSPATDAGNGHGHSHGPGGHSHGHGASEAKAPAAAD